MSCNKFLEFKLVRAKIFSARHFQKKVPPEVTVEVNEFLIQLEEERNETGVNVDEPVESKDDDNEEDSENEGNEEEDDYDIEVV